MCAMRHAAGAMCVIGWLIENPVEVRCVAQHVFCVWVCRARRNVARKAVLEERVSKYKVVVALLSHYGLFMLRIENCAFGIVVSID